MKFQSVDKQKIDDFNNVMSKISTNLTRIVESLYEGGDIINPSYIKKVNNAISMSEDLWDKDYKLNSHVLRELYKLLVYIQNNLESFQDIVISKNGMVGLDVAISDIKYGGWGL